MAETSARFALPWLQPGQAQKEMIHNEALATIDALLHAAVEQVGASEPPASPVPGQAWILGPAPSGAWANRGHAIAWWTDGGWRFVAPAIGLCAWSIADGMTARWTGTAWRIGELDAAAIRIDGQQVVGERAPPIANPAGGGTIDVEARASVAAILQALRAHGLIAA